MALMIPVGEAFIALFTAFSACEIGQRLSYAFDRINRTLDQSDWYLLPLELKRIFPMFVGITQQPIELECYGSITCVRPVFKDVNDKQINQTDENL